MAGERTVDLNKSLKEYLSRNGSAEGKSLLKSFSLDSWFSKSESSPDDNARSRDSWYSSAEESSFCPSLSKTQRIVGFVTFLCLGIFFLVLSTFYIPLLLLKARKFAILYTTGSLCVIGSFSMLWGPLNHIKHLFSTERLPFSIVYFGTMALTMYSALWVRNSFITGICASFQVLALIWYVVSYIPGGVTGFKFLSRICTSFASKTASKALPV